MHPTYEIEVRLIDTRVSIVDRENPDPTVIAEAAGLLRSGELVAFPTETVYGLGADAFDPDAVSKIYEAKGRPSTNPLIVHVADADAARFLTSDWPIEADLLADRFWPGPLSLVLPRADSVPGIVSAGKPTVALRVPSHPVALALLRAAGVPVAAPSANRSEQLSPTTAGHVLEGLDGLIPLILDGGATTGGIESTVLALTANGAVLLRPGLITPAEIEECIGEKVTISHHLAARLEELASPGQMARHYAPRARLSIEQDPYPAIKRMIDAGDTVGWLAIDVPDQDMIASLTSASPEHGALSAGKLILVKMPVGVGEYSALLYARLHDLDRLGVTRIVVQQVPDSEEWLAVRDRLGRAAYRE